MARILLISYDLSAPDTSEHYERLIGRIKNLGMWAKPLESFWLVQTDNTVQTVRDDLMASVQSNDRLLVLDITGDGWASLNLSADVVNWMKNHL